MNLYYLVNKLINYHLLSISANTVDDFPLKVTLAKTLHIGLDIRPPTLGLEVTLSITHPINTPSTEILYTLQLS